MMSNSARGIVPVSFEDCYGWSHSSWGDTGVLICPGIGSDGSNAYRSLRLLATDLADSGYSVLRLDYRGSGNAADLDGREPSAAWLASIVAAMEWLRATGVQRIVLCGYRLGALLVGVATAERDDVCANVMIDPVTSGSSYLRELRIAGFRDSGRAEASEDALEVDGLKLPDGPDAPLRAMNLQSSLAASCRHALLLSSAASHGAAKLADAWRVHGVELEQAPLSAVTGYDEDGYIRQNPDFDKVPGWLRQIFPSKPLIAQPQHQTITAVVASSVFTERSIYFGCAQNLFGILCSPRTEVVPGLVLLIGNIGAVSHQGYGRFHVTLARRLASAGFSSFRFDFAGIGDSDAHDLHATTHIYATDRVPDFAASMDSLGTLGYKRFVAMGICSGAYHAWRAALAEDRLQGLVMLNPTTFFWSEGQSLKDFLSENARTTQSYLDSAVSSYLNTITDRREWAKLVRGELRLTRAACKATRIVGTRVLRYVTTTGQRAAGFLGYSTSHQLPLQAMQGLSARGVRALLLIGTADSGFRLLQRHFGRDGQRLSALPAFSVRLMPDVDHSFSLLAMQEEATQAILSFLREVPVAEG